MSRRATLERISTSREFSNERDGLVRQAKLPRFRSGAFTGVGSCNCDNCHRGINIPVNTVCCRSLLSWDVIDGFGDARILKKTENADEWATAPFDGPTCNIGTAEEPIYANNEYRWVLLVANGEWTTFSLELVTDNGCPVICLVYRTSTFHCECDNRLDLYRFSNVPRPDIACAVCVKPNVSDLIGECENCASTLPDSVTIELPADMSSAGQVCELISGTNTLYLNCGGGVCGEHCRYSVVYDVSPNDVSMCFDIVPNQNCQALTDLCPIGAPTTGPTYVLSCGTFCGMEFPQYYSCEFWDGESDLILTRYDTLGEIGCGGQLPDTITVVAGSAPPTDDGLCGDPCEPATAPVDAEGACCIDGLCYDITEGQCSDFAGVWHATDAACIEACQPADEGLGSCCHCPEATSEYECEAGVSNAACDALGGLFTADGECPGDCEVGEACASTTGACCKANLSCDDDFTQAQCDEPNGNVWAGAGTTCAGTTCCGEGTGTWTWECQTPPSWTFIGGDGTCVAPANPPSVQFPEPCSATSFAVYDCSDCSWNLM